MLITEGQSENQQFWEIGMFRAEDAPGVVELYRAIYGDHFPLQAVYDPDWHIAQLDKHDSYRVVARLLGGEIIGTGALFRSVPSNADLYEAGGVMLLEQYKNEGIALQIMQYIHHDLPRARKIEQIWSEGVCNHVFTQMMSIKSGGVACALEVDLLPAASFENQTKRGLDLKGRVSALVIFQLLDKDKQTIFLPRAYEEVLKKLYQSFQLAPGFVTGERECAMGTNTIAAIDTKGEAGFSRITVTEVGEDFAVWLERTEAEVMNEGATVFQVILPLHTPAIHKAVEDLKKSAYWLGGLLPRWYRHDGFLMQKTLYEPAFDKINVYSKMGKELLEMVKIDYYNRTT